MEALRLAVLDEHIAAQLDAAQGSLDGIEVVWAGTDLARFLRESDRVRPDVIAIDLELLSGDPVVQTGAIAEETGADAVFVTYAFAKRELIRRLGESRARPLRAPVSLEGLRGLLSSMMVRRILGSEPAARVAAPPPQSEGPRYTVAQLGHLARIESAVECECPANLADVLTQLGAFERYSAGCASRNEEDRQIHQMLHAETTQARTIMERALTKLLEHEKIEI